MRKRNWLSVLCFRMKKAKKLYTEREKAYRKLADVVVDVEKLTLDEQIALIAKKCKV